MLLRLICMMSFVRELGRSTQSRQPVSVKPPTKGQFTWSKTSKDKSHEAPETTPETSKSYGKQKTELKTPEVKR